MFDQLSYAEPSAFALYERIFVAVPIAASIAAFWARFGRVVKTRAANV